MGSSPAPFPDIGKKAKDLLNKDYIFDHTVNPTTSVGAKLIRRFSNHANSFTIGSSYSVDPFTTVKTRLSNNGKVGMVVQREWRPKSLITLSAEYDSKDVNSPPRVDLALALKP